MNLLRQFDANANRLKEAVKHDNFKRYVIARHSWQTMQVRERQLGQRILKSANSNNATHRLRQQQMRELKDGYVSGMRHYAWQVEGSVLTKARARADAAGEVGTSEEAGRAAAKQLRKELARKARKSFQGTSLDFLFLNAGARKNTKNEDLQHAQ